MVLFLKVVKCTIKKFYNYLKLNRGDILEMEITVIIPLYKGNKYIPYLVKRLKKNKDNLRLSEKEILIEVLFINDYPQEKIEVENQIKKELNIRVYNLSENQGIHGARVFGYEKARGSYILFLDQDDEITDNYLISQLEHIRENDAVVCNGYLERFGMAGKRSIFGTDIHQLKVRNIEAFIKENNIIVSPGQVLIKKDAIPQIWISDIMKVNGADDYLLWLLMHKENKKFGINTDKIYTHINHGENTSADKEQMKNSLEEMYGILERNGILDEEEKTFLKAKIESFLSLNKFGKMMILYDYWMHLKINGRSTAEYFKENGYYKIAIYGMNHIGNRLFEELKDSDIEVVFGIDQNAALMEYEIPIYERDKINSKFIEKIDGIVVTAVSYFEEIVDVVKEKYDIPMLSIEKILVEMCIKMRDENKRKNIE